MNSTLQAVPKALYHETVLKKHRNNIALNTIATLFASLSDIEPCQVDGLRNSQVQTRRKKKGLQFCSVYIWERKWALPLSSGLIVRISHPVFVTSKVCSNWAERFPSCNEPQASLNSKKNKLTPTRNKNFGGYPVTEGFQIHHQLKHHAQISFQLLHCLLCHYKLEEIGRASCRERV